MDFGFDARTEDEVHQRSPARRELSRYRSAP
jgi:hypothetical protein